MSLRWPFSLLILVTITVCLLPAVLSDQNQRPSKFDDAKFCPTAATPDASCSISCFRADPVCGADGVTYTCGCPDAHCAGTSVVKLGPCDGKN